ncbi:TlpA disulfide reductase family protein [Tamlana sp. 2201CG12-4]|uniref:TlpA disulfide reductase family protein n=1 Tax=Tamlana sp. 2201CG12-4 TaxID=3112582 RepID=UPI002DBA7A8D|nr:TlpA disulfide reductase family protein [Tamlana sp. 2201CG12-4]MEC3907101.1 TlpA disulfide reductase family protein [Tamlana sp. 2201CG12-4]
MKLIQVFKLFLITITIFSCNEASLEPGKYRINGSVAGVENGEIYVLKFPDPVDTIKVNNGRFIIENDLKEIVGTIYISKEANLREMNRKIASNFFIEPAIMELDLNYEDLSKSKLTGSKTQDDQNRLNEMTEKIAANYKNELEHFEAIAEKYKKAAAKGASAEELEAIKYEDNAAREKLAPMWDRQKEIALQFIKDNPKSFVSVQSLLFQLGGMKYDDAKALLDQFNPEHLKIGMGARLASEVENMKKGALGSIAGNFNTIDINGEPLKLADFKGQYLLIDFWASWCVPCRKGNPHLLSLYAEYKPKGLEILGVSDDDRDHKAWRKAVVKDKIGVWRHVLRGIKIIDGRPDFNDKSTDISDGYNISSLPTKILVNPDGVIIGRYGGGGGTDEDMDRDLAAIFRE